jgi:glycosyltransferase involved in cell wall biosynthesis
MEVGGAETLVFQLCHLQREQGHLPCVYTVGNLGALGEQMQKEGFTVQSRVGRNLFDGVRNFFRIFKRTRPDVVHLHNPTPATYAALSARLAGVPCIVSTRHSLVAPPHILIRELKYAFAAACCDWVVAICDATADNLKSLHSVSARKIVRVYNGAVPLQQTPSECWPTKDGFTLVYVGRLEPVKNHVLLLNAFCAAHASMPELRLWMVGGGSERKKLENLALELGISEYVKFWGQQLDVAPFFSAADAFVMSSISEGLPISLLQAFSLGLPAVVTKVGGMAEVVKLAQAGITVPVTDPAAMAAAFVRVAGDDVERANFSANAADAFHSHFTLQTMADAYMKLYLTSSRVQNDASVKSSLPLK